MNRSQAANVSVRVSASSALGMVTTVRAVLARIEAYLLAHPQLWRDKLRVRFAGLGASSLDVRVQAWFTVADWDAFLQVRQDVLLALLDLVAAEGAELAFPTQTLHVADHKAASTAATAG